MSLFGRDAEYLEVVAADFLPDGDKLYILLSDSDCNLHVLQYDPEGELPPQPDIRFAQITNSSKKQTPNPPTATASSRAANSTPATSPAQWPSCRAPPPHPNTKRHLPWTKQTR